MQENRAENQNFNKKLPTAQTAHLFFPATKFLRRKIKELFFAIA